jgi:hypothetical protein
MTPVAKRAVRGSATAAERKRGFAGQVKLVAISVDDLDNAVWIVYAQRTVGTHCNRNLRHETSGGDEYCLNYCTKEKSSQFPILSSQCAKTKTSSDNLPSRV